MNSYNKMERQSWEILYNEAPDLVDGWVGVDLADVSPVILLLDCGYVQMESSSYLVKKRVS